MLRVECHCHTICSKDSLTTPESLIEACRRKQIDRVVVTDHNTIAGARAAYALAPDLVIVGEEIMTTGGEILAFFVREEIPTGLSPEETISRLKEQGAFISISHPFDVRRKGHWRMPELLDILPLIDAIETYNARCWLPVYNRRARAFADAHRIPGTVGSDAHATLELGRALLLVEQFEGPQEMREVIRNGSAQVHWSPPWFHLFSRYAVLRKWLKVGLDTSKLP